LQAYAGKDIPLEYAKQEVESKRKHLEEWQHAKGMASGSFTLSSLFLGRSNVSSFPDFHDWLLLNFFFFFFFFFF